MKWLSLTIEKDILTLFFFHLFILGLGAPALAQRPQLLPLLQRPLPRLHDVPALLFRRPVLVENDFL